MYNIEGIEWFLKMVRSLTGKTVCELGNQHIWEHAAKRVETIHEVARDWMLDLGARSYVSLDVNGQDGARKIDLARCDLDFDLYGAFDVVTNIGTSEHVIGEAPYTKATLLFCQCQCFMNMLALCREGGLMIHQVPMVGTWLDHCNIHYRPGFPQALARACGSPLVANELVPLTTLNPDTSLMMFAIMKHGDGFDASCIDELTSEIEVRNA